MTLLSEILECVSPERKPKDTDKKYFLRIAKAIDGMSDDEFEAMPEAVRKWHESVIDAAEASEDFPIPSDEEIAADPKEGEEKPKKSKKDKKSKKSKKDKKNKKDKKSKKEKEEDTDPEPEKEEPETKSEKVDKKKPKKKDKEMAKAKKDKKPDKKADKKTDKKERGERQPALDPTARISLLVKKNPRREGTSVYENYAIYKTGMTVKKYLEKGGIAGCLRTDIKRGNIELVTK